MKKLAGVVLGAILVLNSSWAWGNPGGLWKTIDDATQKERSLVRIQETNGVWVGKIEKVLNKDPSHANQPGNGLCTQCKDERKDQPIEGMLILRNVKLSAADANVTEGGDITDPTNGNVYRVRLTVLEGGKKLQVRGYLGPFYRTQIWHRAD
jgi:uncharacterized protein (DUF2147 family)